MSRAASAPSLQRTRTPRVLLIPFDGTWASRLTHATVVSEFPSLIFSDENVDNGYREGVGTRGGPIERAFGGALGSGVVINVLEAFIKLADDYKLGDTIVVVGFSRGAFAARVFAALISEVGLLKTDGISPFRKRLFYQRIRDGLVSGNLWDNDTLDEVRDGYEFYDDVLIDALCLFDTVAALGVPKVGAGAYVAPILRMFFRHDYAHFEKIVNYPPEKVRHIFQAISIQETRATYREQVAHKYPSALNQVFKQMWFFGNHSNMARNSGRNGLADAPLAWVIGQLHHYLRLRFDEGKLHQRFPSYPRSVNLAGAQAEGPSLAAASTSGTANNLSNTSTNVEAVRAAPTSRLPPWIYKDIKKVRAFKRFLHGHNQRTPGRYGDQTFEEIHITVRLRNFGRNNADLTMVPGYQVVADGRKWVWRKLPAERAQTCRWMIGIRKPAPIPSIDEGTMLPLEAALLGLSWCLNT